MELVGRVARAVVQLGANSRGIMRERINLLVKAGLLFR